MYEFAEQSDDDASPNAIDPVYPSQLPGNSNTDTIRTGDQLMGYRFRLAVMCVACCVGFALGGMLLGLIFSVQFVGFCIGAVLGFGYYCLGVGASEQFILDAYDARVIDALTSPNLYKTMRKLCAEIGIDDPLLYSMPFQKPNALAVARPDRSSVIILTEGLMKNLEQDEVRAILALMVTRIAKREAAAWSVGATLAGVPLLALSCLAFRDFIRSRRLLIADIGVTRVEKILLSIAVPPCSWTLRLAFDSTMMSEADRAAAKLGGSPTALASALRKIEREIPETWWATTGYNPATALLFAVPPLASPDGLRPPNPFTTRMQSAFTSSLPTVEERCAKLQPVAEEPAAVPV